ncbi:MAG: tRNA (N6-threonylcarbamoyladenosine(37)-N6)-methyltransferase TrmO [Prevotella sp.]|nr:tRNA (N6-threonylcarbamoyladenosine(37)-N6)-methyltransferase TrmO [Prevotella sp.]
MEIKPIAFYHSALTSKFGIPRQSGLAASLQGRIVLEPEYRREEAVRGLEDFDYLWLIWEFSANPHEQQGLTVRPPRLGGNERVGVFASRSPFRPNRLGLSCAYISKVEMTQDLGPVIHVRGADLMDGTPIYDIKPYVAYADSHAEARSGFVDSREWSPLKVEMGDEWLRYFQPEEREGLLQVLAQDPRPRYHDDGGRIYGMPFGGRDVRFRVNDGVLTVVEVVVSTAADSPEK